MGQKKWVFMSFLLLAILATGCGAKSEKADELTQEYRLLPNDTVTVENPEAVNLADLLQKAASGAMVQLRAGNQTGSGVIMKLAGEEMIIATAGHVIQDGKAEIIFADGYSVECGDIRVSEAADVGFLRVSAALLPKETLEACRYVSTDKESYDLLGTGDAIVIIGSVDGVAEDAYEGEVVEPWIYMEDFDQYMILGRAYASAGMSGGGVFDQNGHLIGLLCGVNEETEGIYQDIAVLPLNILLSELDSN